MNTRTDLAVESVTEDLISEKIHFDKRGRIFDITEIIIDDDSCIESAGKGKGTYITLEGDVTGFSSLSRDMAQELAEEIGRLIPEGDIFVAGLGNRDITPDAIGPLTAEKVLATRHLRDELGEGEDFLKSLRRVSTFAGGVLGQTGIETAEIIKSICNEIKPEGIIAVDALACSDISRLGTAIQISDSGISPGSGVSNARKEVSGKLLGIPVISIGIPTVADMRTIVRNVTGTETDIPDMPEIMVTPRNIDRLAERASQLIAYAVNLALHPSLSFEDIINLF